MGKSKSDSTPIAIEKTLCEDFKDLCDDEGLTFNEGIVTLMQNAVDEWQISSYYEDDEDEVIVNDWKDVKENGKE